MLFGTSSGTVGVRAPTSGVELSRSPWPGWNASMSVVQAAKCTTAYVPQRMQFINV